MPLLHTLMRMVLRSRGVSDDFNRSVTSGLGQTNLNTHTWQVITGTWSVNGSRATTSTSHSSNPLATVETFYANIDASLDVGTGDALYFRVQNASNWWRILWEGWQSSSCSTCCDTCCSTCCEKCSSSWDICKDQHGHTVTDCANCGPGSCVCPCSDYDYTQSGTTHSYSCYLSGGGSCTYNCNCTSCNCVSCNCVSCNCVYYNNYRPLLQRNVAGTLTTVYTGSVQSSPSTARLRVVTNGNTITAYRGSTQMWTGTDSAHATQTKHGIGRGSSSYNSSAIDNLTIDW